MRFADSESFVAYPSRWRRALLSLSALGFVALGLWMVGTFGPVPTSSRRSSTETVIAGWACPAISSLCLVAHIPRLFETGEQLRVDGAGIQFSPWSSTAIPWPQIKKVTLRSYSRSDYIVFHLENRRLFPGKGLAKLLAGLNRMMTGGDICISLSGTDRSYDEAISAIARYKPLE